MTRLTATLRAICLLSALLAGGAASAAPPGATPPPPAATQASFATAEEAAGALAAVLKAGDSAQIVAILGPGSAKLVSSGDPYADAEARRQFLESYQTQHRLTAQGADKMILEVGTDAWPLPIPIVQVNGRWQFDSEAGAQELVNRRIGRNELSAIRACLAFTDAQAGYRVLSGAAAGGRWEYAQRIISSRGKRDGLYWPGSVDSADASPLAQVIADAEAEGYPTDVASGKQIPYHGYLFRVLKAQGPNAPGGARSYVVGGRMTEGFGLVAWPASYGSSGIMTFVVNQDGVVYQKDLGPKTATAAAAITRFDPDVTWARVDIVNQ